MFVCFSWRGEKCGQHHSSCFGLWHSLSWLCCESITPLSLIGRDGLSSESVSGEEEPVPRGQAPRGSALLHPPRRAGHRADGVGFPRSAAPGLCFKVTPQAAALPRPPSLSLLSSVSFNYTPIESLKGGEGGVERSHLSPKMSQIPGFAFC